MLDSEDSWSYLEMGGMERHTKGAELPGRLSFPWMTSWSSSNSNRSPFEVLRNGVELLGNSVLHCSGFPFHCNWQLSIPAAPSPPPGQFLWSDPTCLPAQSAHTSLQISKQTGSLSASALVELIVCYLDRLCFPPWTSNGHGPSALFSRYRQNGLFHGVFPTPSLVADPVFCPVVFVPIWQVDSSGQDSHEGD